MKHTQLEDMSHLKMLSNEEGQKLVLGVSGGWRDRLIDGEIKEERRALEMGRERECTE